MALFRPPTQPDALIGGGEASHPLWRHYGAYETGVTVWKTYHKAFTDLSRFNNEVTINFAEDHNLTVGEKITVVCFNNSSFNGTFTITATPTTALLTYVQSGADDVGGTGSVTQYRDTAYPYQGGAEYRTYDDTTTTTTFDDPKTGLADALTVYMGGGEYPIDSTTQVELTAAGYLDNISEGYFDVANFFGGTCTTPGKSRYWVRNIEVDIDVTLTDWSPAAVTTWLAAIGDHIFGMDLEWAVSIHNGGGFRIAVGINGNDFAGPEFTAVPFTDNTRHLLRFRVNTTTGDHSLMESVDNGINFSHIVNSPLNDPLSILPNGPFKSRAIFSIPGAFSGHFANGGSKLHRVTYRDDINGKVIAEADFRNIAPGTKDFADSLGNLWTVNGFGSIKDLLHP